MSKKFRSIHSEVFHCEVCDKFYNVSDEASIADHDLVCPIWKRNKFYEEKQNVQSKAIQESTISHVLERKKTIQLWEEVQRDRSLPRDRPVSTLPAYSLLNRSEDSGNIFTTPEKDKSKRNFTINTTNDDRFAESSFSSRFQRTSLPSLKKKRKSVNLSFPSEGIVCESPCVVDNPDFTNVNSIELGKLFGKNSDIGKLLDSDDEPSTMTTSGHDSDTDPDELVDNYLGSAIHVDGNNMCSSVSSESPSGNDNPTNLYTPTLAPKHDNERCLLYLMSENEFGRGPYHYNSREKCYMELSQIITAMNIPQKAYKEILHWAQRAKPIDLLNPIGRKTLIKHLANVQGLEGTFPHTEVLNLPSGNSVKVTKFDFASQILSLLSEETLMDRSNLILDGDLFKRAMPQDFRGDIETGEWFVLTQNKLCKQPNDILCPLILYIDKTHVNSHGIEAISFTLGKFHIYPNQLILCENM